MRIRGNDGAAAAALVALAVFVAWAPGAAAQAEPEAPAPAAETPAAASGEAPDYRIGAADVIRVNVWRNPELSAEVPVRPDGRISVPLLGDVQAAGHTTDELRERIASGLSEYITAPDVTVIVSQVNSKVVYLVGEVMRPTALPLNHEMRVLDAIAAAGGFTAFADKGDIKILRPGPDGSVEKHEFNYGKFVKGKRPESNLLLRSGDTIVVPD